ncbi:hypothetical protein ANTQUA_LOCUS1506 [Anthophora quadrimaculata]
MVLYTLINSICFLYIYSRRLIVSGGKRIKVPIILRFHRARRRFRGWARDSCDEEVERNEKAAALCNSQGE